MRKVLIAALGLNLFIIIVLLVSFVLIFNNSSFFSLKEFSPEEKTKVTQIASFLEGKGELPAEFNEREKSHMLDVKNLINNLILVLYILIILEIILFVLFKPKLKEIIYVFLTSSLLILLLIIILASNFTNSFIFFHKIFFTGATWLFPYDSNLIKLFPLNFFYSFAARILIYSLLISVLLLIISLIFYFLKLRKQKFY